MKKTALTTIALLLSGIMFPGKVGAEVVSCQVSATPTTTNIGQTGVDFNIAITNTDSVGVNWIRVDSQSEYIPVASIDTSWTKRFVSDSQVELSGEVLSPSQTLNLGMSIDISAELGGYAGSWTVVLSDDGGATQYNCSEDNTQYTINSYTAPSISNINLTVGNSSATLTWNTDAAATGIVNYGTSSGYGSRVTTASGTSHSATMSSLGASTTYHYQIQAIGEGGTTSSADATFTTSAASVTTTTTTTVTNTVEQTVTRIITDTTPPVVRLTELEKKVFETAPIISGSVSDDRGVAKVEYRIKGREESWSNASLEGEVGAKKMSFEFLPPVTLDGTYEIEVRAVDVFGNVSAIKSILFVIDQLLPTVGGGVINYGALPLYAVGQRVVVIEGRDYEVVMYENGGADQVTLIVGDKNYPLSKASTNGLWRGVVKFQGSKEVESLVKAVDGAGNETERTWVAFKILPQGKLMQNGKEVVGAEIKVYWLDPTTKRYQVWDMEEYGVMGSEAIVDGKWGYVLPKGEYYLEASVAGQKIISQKLNLENTTTISGDWEIGQARWWEKIFKIRRLASLPAIQQLRDSVNQQPSLSVGREKWIGKKSVVYLGTKELPWHSESLRNASELAKREDATLVELRVQGEDDPKGEWLTKLGVGLLPQVYLVNDKGDTIEYKEGIWER